MYLSGHCGKDGLIVGETEWKKQDTLGDHLSSQQEMSWLAEGSHSRNREQGGFGNWNWQI